MRLTRVRIEALRQFREPVELHDLDAGLNLFIGPNAAGKSTIVRAIRAAFFERYASSGVTDLLPWGEPDATPSVEVDFRAGTRRYCLHKRFLGRKRCRLEIDGKGYENAEAEGQLADLLGFQYAGKGSSKPEHWGVPGLLWIEQGQSGQELHEAVGHATDHLRKALDDSLGKVASTGGDEVFQRVRSERDRLLTRTGQATGEFREVAGLLAEASAKAETLAAQLAAYREQVDRFGVLTSQVLAASREQPWKPLQAQARAAQDRLDQIGKARDALAADRQLFVQIEAQVRLLEQQQLDQHERRRDRLARISELQSRHEAISSALAQGTEIVRRLAGYREDISGDEITGEQMQLLRRYDRDLQEARIRLEAMATNVSYRLEPGKSIERDGVSIAGAGRMQLLAPTVLRIAQVGRITIEPGGGRDVVALSVRRDGLESAQAELLRSLGLDSIATAEERLQRCRAARQNVQLEQALLKQLAPKGLDALSAELAAVAAEIGDLQAMVAQSASDPPSALAVDQPRRARQIAAELDAVRGKVAALAVRIGNAERGIESARPELLQQEVERLARSAHEARAAHDERQKEMLALQWQLDAAGAGGLEEQLAEARGRLLRAERRHGELSLRARALDLLARMLQEKRLALTRRLQAPLQKRLDHYLQLLLPGASVTIDEGLRPVALSHPAGSAAEGGFAELSFGTREQLSLISRLAYADLLAAADRPTLVIIDDGLVNSDTARLSRMKRILQEAARRHQILLFSCHPERWQDLGTVLREIRSPAIRGSQGLLLPMHP